MVFADWQLSHDVLTAASSRFLSLHPSRWILAQIAAVCGTVGR
jgi:hypothetical protein